MGGGVPDVHPQNKLADGEGPGSGQKSSYAFFFTGGQTSGDRLTHGCTFKFCCSSSILLKFMVTATWFNAFEMRSNIF